jgi:hypothetical protein
MKQLFLISTPNGFVAGYLRAHDLIQTTTTSKAHAKHFTSAAAAQKYLDTYADAGYGLNSDDATIILL